MHYYQHHIGDFIRDTSQLTDSQCMAYLRMIWLYYDTEQALPNKPKVLAFKIGSDPDTVELLLEAFFQSNGDVWQHTRCDSEIAEYAAIRERNATNGKLGGRPRKNPEKPSGFPVGSQSDATGNPDVSDAQPRRNPDVTLTSNHKPITNNQDKTPLTPQGGKSRKGEKLPIGFEIPQEWIDAALTEMRCTPRAVDSDQLAFIQYYTNGKGKNESHIDWRMTWRNWYRKSYSECSKSVSENRHEKRQPVDNSAVGKVRQAIAERDAQLGSSFPPDDFIELGSADYQTIPY